MAPAPSTPPQLPPWVQTAQPWLQLVSTLAPMLLSAWLISSWDTYTKQQAAMREDLIKMSQTLLMICEDIKTQDGTDDRQDEAIAQLRVQLAGITPRR